MSKERDGRIVLSDPRAIRALAHPARLAILEALLPGEELTATEAASVTGLSPSATSYHLKALERWGIVAAGQPRADGRDRPWKATGRSIEVSSDAPRTVLAETAVLGVFLDRNRALAAEFLEHQDEGAGAVAGHHGTRQQRLLADLRGTRGDFSSATTRPRTVRATPVCFPAGREPAGPDSAPHRAARER
jgi:DNA-binding transcriptional ArsR family regulator